jgi:hypothetical protein
MDKAMATLMAMVADSGVEIDESELNIPRHNYRSSDAVVVFAHLPAHFKPGKCKECGRTFAVNMKSVGYCSDPCRDENWRRTTGLSPNVVKIHDVWHGDPPMIVTPDQYDKLKAIADWFTKVESELQVVQTEPIETEDLRDSSDIQVELLEASTHVQEQEASLFSQPTDAFQTSPVASLDLSEPEQMFLEVEPFEL